MRLVVGGLGCLAVGILSIIGIVGIISVLNPLLASGTRIAWGTAAVVALGAGWFIWDRGLRSGAARNAQRNEKPGTKAGTRVRTYRGYAYDIAVDWFKRDAKLLIPSGYRVIDTSWETYADAHPARYWVLWVVGLLTRGTNWGQEGGTLTVTYELGSTPEEAATTAESFAANLRKGPREDRYGAFPFAMTLPPLWEPGPPPRETPPDLLADAYFFARDPQSSDPDYFATVLVMAQAPTSDPKAFLTDQEAGFRSSSATEEVSVSRVSLPAGDALLAIGVRDKSATVQYFVPTAFATFAIWFTSPRAELSKREPEFDAIARSFHLT